VAETPFQIKGTQPESTEPPSIFQVLSDALKRALAGVQDYALLSVRALSNLATGPVYAQDIVQQMDVIGVGSLPIILLCGIFIGAVTVLQTGSQFTRF